jgi:hypothetical protein
MPNQAHTGLFRCAPAFSIVAVQAARDDIVPRLAPTPDDRDDMIECKVFRGALGAAVLAGVQIPGIDVGPAEFDVLEALPHPDVSQESEHARHSDSKADAVDFAIIFSQHLHLALE